MISKKSQIAFIRSEAESCKRAYHSLRETFGTASISKIAAELLQRQQYYKAILKTLKQRNNS